jgi:uncharacterized protein
VADDRFLYKLVPPRPTFDSDMTEEEAAIMREHVAYWQGLLNDGVAVVFGPVRDPSDLWGLAVVEAETEEDVRRLERDEPAQRLSGGDVPGIPDAGGDRTSSRLSTLATRVVEG